MINKNIQVLRGISVLLVLFFHLELTYLQFGYIGVDVFFLISGFLMPIILPKYDAWGFIVARTKRLLPAVAAMVIVVLTLGYFLQMPGEYKEGGIVAVSALFFLSQYYFIQNTGYFDMDASYQPLMHTWSLGGEYLAYLIVFAFLLISKKWIKIASVLAVVVSVIYILLAPSFYTLSYFDPIPRLYLFFVAFYISIERHRINLANSKLILISLFAIGLVYIFAGESISLKEWPNYSILLFPACVLPLVLFSGDLLPVKFVTSTLSKVGDWSYSIYIWHWPIIVFERIYIRNSGLNSIEFWLLLGISLVVGIFSYMYIERRKFLLKYGFVLALIISVGILISDGASYRVPGSLSQYSSIDLMIDDNYFIKDEVINNFEVFTVSQGTVNHRTAIIGDSHSRHILPIYDEGYDGDVYRILAQPGDASENWKDLLNVIDLLKVDRVLFAYRLHMKDISSMAALFKKINLDDFGETYEVAFVRDIPSLDGDPVACLFSNESSLLFKDCGFDIRKGLPERYVRNGENPIWDYVKNNAGHAISLIDTHSALCEEGYCITMVNGEFILRDDNHFNEMMSVGTNGELFDLIFSERLN